MPCALVWCQFECLIGLMKAAFYKTVGQGLISWGELSEVILDIELTMNNCLLLPGRGCPVPHPDAKKDAVS